MTDSRPDAEKTSGGRGAGRTGKKQIVCFLTPEENSAARIYAQSMSMTRQSLLGRAINRYLESLGERPLLNDRVTRLLCMTNSRVRKFHNPYGRYGKSALAGWFSDDAVTNAAIALMRHGSNFQQAAIAGLVILGASSPQDNAVNVCRDPDAMAAPASDSSPLPDEVALVSPADLPVFPDLTSRDGDLPDF